MSDGGFYLLLHVLGFVLWIGVTFTLAFVTGRAHQATDRRIAAFAYRAASKLLRSLGLTGMVLTVGGGMALTAARGYSFFQPSPDHWLFQMQVWGLIAFAVAVLYQIPLSDRLARAAEASAAAGEDSSAYQKYRKRYALVSSLIGLVLLVLLALGTLRP